MVLPTHTQKHCTCIEEVYRRLLKTWGKAQLYYNSITSPTRDMATGYKYSQTKQHRRGGATRAHLFCLFHTTTNSYKAGMIPARLGMRKLTT